MKRHTLPHQRIWRALMFSLMAVLLAISTGVAEAKQGTLKRLPLQLSEDRRSATVQVPPGYGAVMLQQFKPDAGWRKIAVKKKTSGAVRFDLPASREKTRWRAVGRLLVRNRSQDKFPAAFYEGKTTFGPLKVGNSRGWLQPGFGFLDGGVKANDEGAAPPGEEPVEADIWKTDGNTVYFFNQLRGLQVLDVSDAADPRLTASLRMPALGQDLYLLGGGSDGEKNIVLLTEGDSDDGWNRTRIHLVHMADGKAEITHSRTVKGYLADSRMVGNRLILATSEWLEWENGGIQSETLLSEWTITPGKAPALANETRVSGDNAIIAAGTEWLAVCVNPPGRWDVSNLTVFGIRELGLVRLTETPLRTAGRVEDHFKIQWRNDVLTTISEKNRWSAGEGPVTVLENFRVPGPDSSTPVENSGKGPRIAALELAAGESLFATRFAGDKAYIVTFLQTDPLWVVDLTDPVKPIVAGHLEVPGWSTHLEPIGNFLFSVGWESDTVAASLFDVSDPAAPKLMRRLNLGSPGSYSEAAWDEKALKVLPGAGLAMIPLTTYDPDSGESKSSIQLLDIDLTKGDLVKRGAISHDFDARRSNLVGDHVISISQRVMVAAAIADRDSPEILSEVSLAWPVDKVLDGGSHLIQIEAGNSWGGGRATARISSSGDTEQVFSETDLGEGTVRFADLRDGKLFVLREVSTNRSWFYRSPVVSDDAGKLSLDIHDASALPALVLTGSVETEINRNLSLTGAALVWPLPDHPAVLLDARPSFGYWWDMPVPIMAKSDSFAAVGSSKIMVPALDGFPYWRKKITPQLLVFDVANPEAPAVRELVSIGTARTIPNGIMDAADGLVVIGATDWRNEQTGLSHPAGTAAHSVHVVEVAANNPPVVRPGIDLPGELFAITELDRDGFLAHSRNSLESATQGFTVSACDGFDAYEITGLSAKSTRTVTAGGRELFIATPRGVERHRLSDEGTWIRQTDLDVGWQPDTLRWVGGTLIGTRWKSLFATNAAADGGVKTWNFPNWGMREEQISLANDGDLLVPLGEFGAERLDLVPGP